MEMDVYNVLGVIGIMGIYIWLKVWIYKREYKENKENTNRVIKRGNEWD